MHLYVRLSFLQYHENFTFSLKNRITRKTSIKLPHFHALKMPYRNLGTSDFWSSIMVPTL